MELKQIKELMAVMEKAGIKKLSIREKTGYELHLERHEEHPHVPPPVSHHAVYPIAHSPFPHREEVRPALPKAIEDKGAETVKEGKYVTSPMVGTYYASPSPDDPPFVKVGDQVNENTVLCIIEAMKVMNEVKAGVKGVVAEILVDNAHPLEFGTKIFRIV